jgi:hypothetical protein
MSAKSLRGQQDHAGYTVSPSSRCAALNVGQMHALASAAAAGSLMSASHYGALHRAKLRPREKSLTVEGGDSLVSN